MEPDVTIQVEGETFPVHSYPLMASSKVFCRMLEGDMSEAHTGLINLPGKSKKEFRLVLPWISTVDDKPPVQRKHVAKLLQWADEYEIKTLRDACERFLLEQPINSVKQLMVAARFRLSARMKQCVDTLSEDLPIHMASLRCAAKNPEVMSLLWPAFFKALGMEYKVPLPEQPSIEQLWPFLTTAVNLSCNSNITISVETLAGRIIECVVKPTCTVKDLKIKIAKKGGFRNPLQHPDLHHLIFAGRRLEDFHPLKYYGIEGNVTVNMVYLPPGQ